MSAPGRNCPEPEGLITQRLALIALIALVIGLVIGSVTFIAYANVAVAVLAGLCALGGTLVAAHALIRHDR